MALIMGIITIKVDMILVVVVVVVARVVIAKKVARVGIAKKVARVGIEVKQAAVKSEKKEIALKCLSIQVRERFLLNKKIWMLHKLDRRDFYVAALLITNLISD